ncbi:hypothetical protein ACFLZL_00935 [Thermodesulfobacteriota bacterium]
MITKDGYDQSAKPLKYTDCHEHLGRYAYNLFALLIEKNPERKDFINMGWYIQRIINQYEELKNLKQK